MKKKIAGLIFISVLLMSMVSSAVFIIHAQGVESYNATESNEPAYYAYSLSDDFSVLNEGNWWLNDPRGVISIDGTVQFTNDRASSGYEGAQMISNVKFSQGADTVFDLSFSPHIYNRYKGSSDSAEVALGNKHIRFNREMSFGVLFGLPTRQSKLSDGTYFRISPPLVELYHKGVKVEPESGGLTSSDSYMDHDVSTAIRLVGMNDGTLKVYLAAASHKLDTLFAVYKNVDIKGYLGFTSNSYNIDAVDLPITFKNISLSGNTVADYNEFDVVSVDLDKSRLYNAVVSDKPVTLSASVQTRPNIPLFHDVIYSVESNDADGTYIENGILYIKNKTPFLIKARSKYNQEKFETFTVNPKELIIKTITIDDAELKKLNTLSQPVILSAVVDSNYSYINEYNEVVFSVESGLGEIFSYPSITGGVTLYQLRVIGSGTVIVKAVSAVHDDKSATLTIEVADGEKTDDGCAGATFGTDRWPIYLFIGLLLMSSTVILIGKGRKS